MDMIEVILTSGSTLLAAYLGAKFAFDRNNLKEEKDRDQSNISESNLAIFTLIRYCNIFHNIKNKVIGDNKSNPIRHYVIKPYITSTIDKPKFNYTGLSFLLGHDPNLFGDLSITENNISEAIETIGQRSKIHLDHFQPAIQELEKEGELGAKIDIERVSEKLGHLIEAHLKQSTDYMIDAIEKCISLTEEGATKLRAAVLKVYPYAKLIKIAGEEKPVNDSDEHIEPSILIARRIRYAVISQTGSTSKFVGWWLIAVGGALAFLAGHLDDSTALLGNFGFIIAISALALAGLAGLASEFLALSTRTNAAVADQLLNQMPTNATGDEIREGLKLALLGQPWPSSIFARIGAWKVGRLPEQVRSESAYVLAARSATRQRHLALCMVSLTILAWFIAMGALLTRQITSSAITQNSVSSITSHKAAPAPQKNLSTKPTNAGTAPHSNNKQD